MNWDDDEEWDNCAPGAFGGDYSDKNENENEKTCLAKEGMDLFVLLGLLNDWL